jgi:hypothetical protein
MTDDGPLAFGEIDLQGPIKLIVVWPRGSGYDGGYVKIEDEIAAHLRRASANTVAKFEDREPREYFADMQLEGEEFLYVNDEELVGDSAVADYVLPAARLQTVNSRSLPSRRIALYAAVLGSGEDMVAFVRKSNPRNGVRSGSLLGSLGNTLTKIDKPIFTLDDHFDLIVDEGGIAALNQNTFEVLFRDTPSLQQRIPEWIEAIGNSSHPFAGDGADRLAKRCQTDGRLRKRVRNIAERGHLAQVGADRIRKHLRALSMDEMDFLTEADEFVLDDGDPFRLVYLLNEDFFKGGLTDVSFRSDRKAPRG